MWVFKASAWSNLKRVAALIAANAKRITLSIGVYI
jgi:hypothetical protein